MRRPTVARGLRETQIMTSSPSSRSSTSERPDFVSMARIAHRDIESRKTGVSRRNTKAPIDITPLMIAVSVVVVTKDSTRMGDTDIRINSPAKAQEVGETLVQLFEKELADWDAFTTALLKALRQNDDIDRRSITDRKLWTQSWGSKLNGGKNVTMALNPDHPVQTPRGYITSGFFQKNPQGHRKLLYVLTEKIKEKDRSDTPTSAVSNPLNRDRKHRRADSTPSPDAYKKRGGGGLIKREPGVKREPAATIHPFYAQELQMRPIPATLKSPSPEPHSPEPHSPEPSSLDTPEFPDLDDLPPTAHSSVAEDMFVSNRVPHEQEDSPANDPVQTVCKRLALEREPS